MKRIFLLAVIVTAFISCKKDPVTPPTEPPIVPPPVTEIGQTGLVTTSKNFPAADSTFTITFDPNKGNAALAGYSGDVYVHLGAITNLSSGASDWKYVKFAWATNDPSAKMTRQSNGKYTITINPRLFLGVPTGENILKLAMVFRSADGTVVGRNTDASDIFIPLYSNASLNVRFIEPEMTPSFEPKPIIIINTVGQ